MLCVTKVNPTWGLNKDEIYTLKTHMLMKISEEKKEVEKNKTVIHIGLKL